MTWGICISGPLGEIRRLEELAQENRTCDRNRAEKLADGVCVVSI
jgi:hypothetical protein